MDYANYQVCFGFVADMDNRSTIYEIFLFFFSLFFFYMHGGVLLITQSGDT